MKKKDIQELQSILTGEFFNESQQSKKIFNDIKNKNSTDLMIQNRHNMNDIKKHHQSKLNNEFSRGRIYVDLKKSECKTDLDNKLFDDLHRLLSKIPKEYFMQDGITNKIETTDEVVNIAKEVCRLFFIDPNKYGVDFVSNSMDRIQFNFIKYSVNNQLIPLKDINKYYFIHFTKERNLENTGITPIAGSSHFHGTYAKKSVFFFAINKHGDFAETMHDFKVMQNMNYGGQAYQYFPKAGDKFYRDVTDKRNIGSIQLKNHFGFVPVLLETDTPIKVTNVTNAINSYGNMNPKYISTLRSKSDNIDKVDTYIDRLSSKCFTNIKEALNNYIDESSQKQNNTKSGPKTRFKKRIREVSSEFRVDLDHVIDSRIEDNTERKMLKRDSYSKLNKRIEDELKENYGDINWVIKEVQTYLHESYIDATIDRFDAFMENFLLESDKASDAYYLVFDPYESINLNRYNKITYNDLIHNNLKKQLDKMLDNKIECFSPIPTFFKYVS